MDVAGRIEPASSMPGGSPVSAQRRLSILVSVVTVAVALVGCGNSAPEQKAPVAVASVHPSPAASASPAAAVAHK